MEGFRKIVAEVSHSVRKIFQSDLPDTLYFHNIRHTEEVVSASIEIGKATGLSDEELEIVVIASWFHDVGYCYKYAGHEELSMEIAEKTLLLLNYEKFNIKEVISCIAATKYPQNPKTTSDMVLCDADLYHLSLETYPHYAENLRKEWHSFLGRSYSDQEWRHVNCILLESHTYFTPFGQQVLQPKKEKNIIAIKCKG